MKAKVGILISGRGSNMAALMTAARAPDYPAEIVAVVSNSPAAPGLAIAAEAGIATFGLDHTAHPSRDSFDQAVYEVLVSAGVEFIACAGFMLATIGYVSSAPTIATGMMGAPLSMAISTKPPRPKRCT